jgi:hypothetical protein
MDQIIEANSLIEFANKSNSFHDTLIKFTL